MAKSNVQVIDGNVDNKDTVTVELEFNTKDKRKKLMFVALFLLLIIIVIIIALTSKGTRHDRKAPYNQYLTEMTGSKLEGTPTPPPTFHHSSRTPRENSQGNLRNYQNMPTPRPTRQPTRRPTRSPTPAPTLPPTSPTPPIDLPTRQPTRPPQTAGSKPPTPDQIKLSMCSGVNVIYRDHNEMKENIFGSCPTAHFLEYYADQPGPSRFKSIKGSNKLYEMEPTQTQLALGLREFLSQVWKDRPIYQTQFGDTDPYLQISRSIPDGYNGDDVRNWLNYIHSHRIKEYIRNAVVNDEAISVVGRTVYLERFKVEISDNIDVSHLSWRFRQRVQLMVTHQGSDQMIDNFIDKFGTHYRKVGVFGGAYGVDYYFSGYGTQKDQDKALQHVLNADMSVCFDALGRRQRLYTSEFAGFADADVECYPWSKGGDPTAITESIGKWRVSVEKKPVLIREELRSIMDLIRVVINDQRILNKFQDRIVARAEQALDREDHCIYSGCDIGTTCMDNKCIEKTMPPRWPNAVSFCLPKPQHEECPSEYDEFYPGSWVYWDTENGGDSYRGHDHITSHGLTSVQVNAIRHHKNSKNGGIQLFFCCHKSPRANHNPWPKGTYCLYAYRYVSKLYDPAWSMISILWNDEDDDNKNAYSNGFDVIPKVPMGRYDNYSSFTEQTLLCRDDGPAEKAIVLPTSFPFYLIQNGDACQEVFGMYWTNVQVTWDTENDRKPYVDGTDIRWNRIAKIPRSCIEHCTDNCPEPTIVDPFCYVGHDKIVMDFCYYQELETPSPTKFPTPIPTAPTPAPVVPTPPPTTPSPSTPPTRPPTKPPTPYPTRPTPSPTIPTKTPTGYPTRFPTKTPTQSPTKAPIRPTKSPTPVPTKAPTPSPTEPCRFCLKLQGVDIVGLNSVWDDQPVEWVFDNVQCQCIYCEQEDDPIRVRGELFLYENGDPLFLCPVKEDCERRFLVGDYMILEKYWLDLPVALTEDDTLFPDITFFHPRENSQEKDYIHELEDLLEEVEADYRTKWSAEKLQAKLKIHKEIQTHTQIDLKHSRNAILYGGSQRMINYGTSYSILERHIGTEKKDTIYSVSHVVMRTRRYSFVEVKWSELPQAGHLSVYFKERAHKLYQLEEWVDSEARKDSEYDNFITTFGTHYVWHAVFGGEYGADFYFTGYGTKPEMKIALHEASNADLEEAFQINRVNRFDAPLSGKSFIRGYDGNPEVGPDIIGWSKGGTEYGVRKTKSGERDEFGNSKWEWGDWRWRESVQNGEDVILWHKKLVSIGDLLLMFSDGVLDEAAGNAVRDRFKFRVVSRAHFWLYKHYWCFFLDVSCQNKRRHPFLREDTDGGCHNPTKKRLRTRTELEVCVGEGEKNDGYMCISPKTGKKSRWCEGAKGAGVNDDTPSNYPPYRPVRKANCPLVAPPPRWPVYFSYCLPKPVGSLSCPVEQYPEYYWNYDWERAMQKAYNEHAADKHKLVDVIFENRVYKDKWQNVNPNNLIPHAYPWTMRDDDYKPRETIPWKDWFIREEKRIRSDENRRIKDLRHDCAHTELELPGHRCDAMTEPEIHTWVEEKIRILDIEKQRRISRGVDYAIYLLKYNASDTQQDYTLGQLNKVYVLHQTPWIDFNGWIFWDTEDDDDKSDIMRINTKETPTHMDPARLYEYDDVLAKQNPKGFQQEHMGKTQFDEMFKLWSYNEENLKKQYATGGIRMDFCCTTIAEDQGDKASHRLHWPDGHFCIYAHGAIDAQAYKFLHGSIGWDCENGDGDTFKDFGNQIYVDPTNEAIEYMYTMLDAEGEVNLDEEVANQQRLTGALPTGLYHIQYDGKSEQYISQNVLCTKMDEASHHYIELPRDAPFYLMQFKGECQNVRGMYWTNVTLTWATEKNHKRKWEGFNHRFIELEMNSWGRATAFGHTDTIPDGVYSQKEITITYCFYQPNSKRDTHSVCHNEEIASCDQEWRTVSMDEFGEYTKYAHRLLTDQCQNYTGIN